MIPGSPEPEQEDTRPQGTLKPLSPGPLTLAGVLGLVLGWLLHPISERVNGSAPLVGWAQGLVLFFVAAILAATAWYTWRATHASVKDGETGARTLVEPHRMVNRLVLGRACALVGAFTAGGYLGYALSWVGNRAELADERIVRSLVACAGALLVMIAALVLERACRVPPRPQDQ